MTVKVTREAEPQFELFGAYTGDLLGGAENTLSYVTFVADGDYLIVVPKNDLSQPQVEAAPTPSSYIPTSGSTVTRAAETLTIPAANLPYSSTAMSIAMEGEVDYYDVSSLQVALFFEWELNFSNRIILRYRTNTSPDRYEVLQVEGGTVDLETSAIDGLTDLKTPFSFATRNTSTAIQLAVDGNAGAEDTTPTALPDLSAADLDLGPTFMGTLSLFRMWDTDLGDSGIEEASS